MTKLIPHILYLITRLLALTYRFEYVGRDKLEKAENEAPGRNYILGLWHQNLLPIFLAHSDRPYTMIVSSSKDGEIIAHACELYGHQPSRGSSTRGGQRALRSMIDLLKTKKIPGAITVDGPVGPAFKAKKGILEIAYKSGAWIIPCSSYASRFWSFNSWDKFRLPKPFSKIVIHYGEPIAITREEDLRNYDKSCRQLEEALNLGTQQAREYLRKINISPQDN